MWWSRFGERGIKQRRDHGEFKVGVQASSDVKDSRVRWVRLNLEKSVENGPDRVDRKLGVDERVHESLRRECAETEMS